MLHQISIYLTLSLNIFYTEEREEVHRFRYYA